MTPRPERVTVRMYQVGFGDCYLVTVGYADSLQDGRSERHILIDFGSTRAPWTGAKLTPIAELIREHCGSKLDVVVVTHRHKDHLSAFGIDDTSSILDSLSPTLIVRPWTEDPRLAPDAAARHEGDGSRQLIHNLRAAEVFAGETARALTATSRRGLVADVAHLAADQVPNQEAITKLDEWAEAGASTYVSYGGESRIEEFVPGITAHVLGPPTVEQWPEMLHQRAVDPDEFWMLNAGSLRDNLTARMLRVSEARPPTGSDDAIPPGPVRWLIEKLDRDGLHALHRIVRSVDDALNNTSVILLLEIGDKRLLFPGDAQIENWSYALEGAPDSAEVRELLAGVDFYKVGHHGSRNATPKSLFDLWAKGTRPMMSFMSTRSGVHGHTEATKVPRETLVAALQHRTSLITTDGLARDRLFVEATAAAHGTDPLVVAEP